MLHAPARDRRAISSTPFALWGEALTNEMET